MKNRRVLQSDGPWAAAYARLGILLLVAVAMPAAAQVMGQIGELPSGKMTADIPAVLSQSTTVKSSESLRTPSNVNRRTGTYGPVVQTKKDHELAIPPFGVDLFSGGFRGPMASGLNPHYEVMPGDRITLRVWGAVEISKVLPVDAKGNIFVPYVGPVHVQGVTAAQLTERVKKALHQVFKDNISVYTNLQGVQPVAVYVTGYVEKPGRYAGTPNASVLYFLDQASGIEERTGSYRDIRIMRDGQTIATVDLYKFLIHGKLPDIQFQSGDTIVVEERGPVITVAGDIAHPFRYELDGESRTGQALLRLVQLDPGVTHALVDGVREDGPIATYVPLDKFRDTQLQAGDTVYFSSDQHPDSIVVQIEGSYKGPSRYVVPQDTTLVQLLNVIEINPDLAAAQNVFIRRESVARRQKKALQDSLRRLVMSYLSASSGTVEEASIRVKEAKLIQEFVKRASQVKPSGVVVVAHNGQIRDIRLQDGDEIVIPEESNVVLLTGEILVPRAMVYVEGLSAREYIRRAGGFTDQANREKILIVRQSGQVLPASEVAVRPGDKIMVLPEAPTKNLQLASTLTQIMFQIAVTAGTVLAL